MGRPPLSLGTWGRIRRYQLGLKSWRAMANYRDYDGVTRPVERHGETGAKAERALLEALRDRARAGGQGEITADTRISEVCRVWFDEFKQQDKASSTVDAYDDALRLHVLPSVGNLRVRELTVGVADRFLISVRDKKGPSAAKHAKTVLSGVMGLATRREAIDHNPMRDVAPIAIKRKDARSLELDEVRRLRAGLRKDKKAVERDIPALVDFMLGTGMRIGEALAVTWEALDLEAGTVEIRATVVRKKGVGLILQPEPKTEAGWRTLHLPPWLVLLVDARPRVENEWNVVFPSQLGKLRDRSNTNADLREALGALGFDWVTSHNFRKTAATLLNDQGLTVREIADQLGHKRVSMTLDTYFGRKQASPKVAELLSIIDE
ncbi:tyrosine-type recombinase/integrase [Amycolatopsis pithecellobii]|uniref:Tyrosine-type recombinase/integrase n=1 Tax=Amycolatopsis pithecellobii TaxID=664692 RepID=A0A6N7ZAP1_9PSEU|nr:site-specific integrase [Amycolatopsis pithecellobii]MTD58824.1 tyrosine-type recombinase/integrase [Amycolatopsis pithecellobii]